MGDTTATIETNHGNLTLEFFSAEAPKHVENFVTLAKKGFYDGLIFHRIIKGFMMQGGCPKKDGTGGPGYTVKAEFNKRPHKFGTLSMARAGDPNSAGSQFFICFKDVPYLDGQYTVFGQLIAGEDIVRGIEKNVKTDSNDRPLTPVEIRKVTVTEAVKK